MVNKTKNLRMYHKVMLIILILLLLIVLIHAIHAMTLDLIMVYNEITFSSPNIPPELNGYRIAFVTDLHAEFMERPHQVVAELNKRNLDLLIIGGDVAKHKDNENDVKTVLELLAQINTKDGIYGVEGNHDNYEILFPAMQSLNMAPLSNAGVYIHDGFYLAGVEDLWNRHPDVSLALDGASPESFILLISHNPDVSMMQETSDVDLILSGHTHDGQLNFFGWLSLGLESRVISRYGEKFRGGWAESRDDTPIYICSGVGEYYPRVFARPEVLILTLSGE
jgi:predicted MPP superfamily phosphohydrolase